MLTWNLKHGLADPPASRYLLAEFGAALADWRWHVALLQEVPPWWPEPLALRASARCRTVLTSRNSLLPLRQALATRWPDAIKSSGGGANAILVRGGEIGEHLTCRLCLLPERRMLHAVRIRGDSYGPAMWFGNLHATAHHPAAAVRDSQLAAQTAAGWAGEESLVLGGDFNQRQLLLQGFTHAGGHDVDHVFVRGLPHEADVEVLERGRLSDHAPVLVTLR